MSGHFIPVWGQGISSQALGFPWWGRSTSSYKGFTACVSGGGCAGEGCGGGGDLGGAGGGGECLGRGRGMASVVGQRGSPNGNGLGGRKGVGGYTVKLEKGISVKTQKVFSGSLLSQQPGMHFPRGPSSERIKKSGIKIVVLLP